MTVIIKSEGKPSTVMVNQLKILMQIHSKINNLELKTNISQKT